MYRPARMTARAGAGLSTALGELGSLGGVGRLVHLVFLLRFTVHEVGCSVVAGAGCGIGGG